MQLLSDCLPHCLYQHYCLPYLFFVFIFQCLKYSLHMRNRVWNEKSVPVIYFTVPDSGPCITDHTLHGLNIQGQASLDYITASATLVTNQHAIAATRYDSDPHTRVHRVFTDMEHPHRCWPPDWTRDQCVTVAQLRPGHSPLLAAYLHRIGRRDSHLSTLQWC